MENYYNVAGVNFCVLGKKEEMFTEETILKKYKSGPGEGTYKYYFQIVENLLDPVGECIFNGASKRIYKEKELEIRYIGSVENTLDGAYMRIEKKGEEACVQVERKKIRKYITEKVVLTALGMEHLVVTVQGFILHASFVNWKGKGILFTAPSGTGKSTQADLWKKFRGAEIINGDKAIIRNIDGEFFACGLPYSGSSKYYENEVLPLHAVVYLGQSTKTTIRHLTGSEAFKKIWEGCSIALWEVLDVNQVISNIQELICRVPIFELKCTPDESAVIVLEEKLTRGR